MAAPHFRFTASWVVPAPPEATYAVLEDLSRYPDWWPQVLAVAKLDDDTARVLCRSALPHTLDLVLRAVHREERLLEVAITGDLEGDARWHLVAVPEGTRLDYAQGVEVTGRALGMASRTAGPLMRWNHDRMMAGCREGLARRLS
jgi:carbon monoxide dehydrogenase subunit G